MGSDRALLSGSAQSAAGCAYPVTPSPLKYMSQRNRGRDIEGLMYACVYHSSVCGKRKLEATQLQFAREINK